jgi:hypothetical protein
MREGAERARAWGRAGLNDTVGVSGCTSDGAWWRVRRESMCAGIDNAVIAAQRPLEVS